MFNYVLLFLEIARFGLLGLVLSLAAVQDYSRNMLAKDHKGKLFVSGFVSNKLWLYGIVGFSLTMIESFLYFDFAYLVLELSSIGLAVFFGFLLQVLHGWGGADAKAFVTIGVSAPLFPVWGVLYPYPLPLVVLFASCALAIGYAMLKPSGVPLKERKVRFLPFMFVGLIIAAII